MGYLLDTNIVIYHLSDIAAATALSHDLTLVTNDSDDYEDIPNLKLHWAQITP